ncbi:MAG: LysM peptidoglycan-binding domain-containing protein [Candidatus Latescibacteria bacterium]|nr:LysM peptidoglycan-binding domain-containing protein [Candidatus Latescibacterota bacterium]
MRKMHAILPAAVLGVMVAGAVTPALAQEKMTLEEGQAALDECNRREATAQSRINELDQQIADLRRQIEDLDGQISAVRQDISGMNQQVSSTQSELTQVKTDLESLQFPETYTVVKGDCLWNIAKKDFIYNDPFKWPRIYEANKDKIKDPDLIYPKQVFTIIRP